MATDEGTFDADVFKGARALSNAEVGTMLKQCMDAHAESGLLYQEPPLVHKTKVYVDRFSQNKNFASSQKIRSILLNYGLREHEQAMVANLAPESVEEAQTLIPSLKDETRFTEEQLDAMLKDVAMYRDFE